MLLKSWKFPLTFMMEKMWKAALKALEALPKSAYCSHGFKEATLFLVCRELSSFALSFLNPGTFLQFLFRNDKKHVFISLFCKAHDKYLILSLPNRYRQLSLIRIYWSIIKHAW